MTARSSGEHLHAPTSEDAARILRDIAPVTRRSRRLTRDAALARPLLAWGLAWIAGAALFQWVAGPGGAVLASLPSAGAAAVCWLVRPREVQLPARRRLAQAWVALLLISPLLAVVAAPANARLLVLFLASLWAAGMVLYGIGTQDLPLALTGLAIVVVAGAARLAAPGAAMVITGTGGGLGMALLGGWRMRWRR